MEKKSIKREREGVERRRREDKEGWEILIYFIVIYPLCFFLISTKIGPQVFVWTEGKVDPRDESYTWTPKSWSFDKLREIGVLSYLKLHFV